MYYLSNINSLKLGKEESIHCLRVLRKQTGDTIEITEGKGIIYKAKLTEIAGKQASFKIFETKQFEEEQPHLHLFIAPTKNINRMEWLLEKCTEVGIKSITPIICKQSERKVVRTDRLKKIILAAMKQSQRAWLPILQEPISFKNIVESIKTSSTIKTYMASYKTSQKNFEEVLETNADANVFIGPEGDFSEEEKKMANNYNFVPVNLGKYRLRTETAGLMATHIFNLKNRNNK